MKFLIIDNGLFVHIAQICAEYEETLYWCEWKRAFPSSDLLMVGDGFENVERVRDLEDALEGDVLPVFTDLYHADLQRRLAREGRPFWGTRDAEILETERDTCREWMEKQGMPVAPWWRVEGVKDLRKLLKEQKNVFVKGLMRGDFETFHHDEYKLTEPMLDELEHKLGPKKNDEVFIVETPVEDEDGSPCVEVGFDGWTIDGEYPETAIVGFEIKDSGYIGAVMPYAEIGKPVRYINEYLRPFFAKRKARGFFSTEVRCKKVGEQVLPYLIDPCLRCGSPCSEGYADAYSNWGHILTGGAAGRIVKPDSNFNYNCELIIYSDWAKENPLAIHVPEEFRDAVKLHYAYQDGETLWVLPIQPGIQQVGAVVGSGDSIEEAVQTAVAISREVKGVEVKFEYGSIDAALKEIRKGIELGIPFGDGEIPEHVEI